MIYVQYIHKNRQLRYMSTGKTGERLEDLINKILCSHKDLNYLISLGETNKHKQLLKIIRNGQF